MLQKITTCVTSIFLCGCIASVGTALHDEVAGAGYTKQELNWRSNEPAQIYYKYDVRDGKPTVCGYFVADVSGFTAKATEQWVDGAHLYVGDTRLTSISFFKQMRPKFPGQQMTASCRQFNGDAKKLTGSVRLGGPQFIEVRS